MVWEFVDEPQKEPSFGERLKGAGKEALRQAGRTGTSILAGGVGGIGDLANLASMGAEKIGLASPEGAQKFREKTLTSEKIRSGFQEQFPSLKPENKIEKFADEVFETLGGLGTGGPGKTIIQKGLRKFGLSLGANLGKEVVDEVKGEEGSKEGNYAKAGLLFVGSLLNPKLAANEATKRYSKAQSLLPEGAQISEKKLLKDMSSLESSVTKGRPYSALSEAEKFVINQIDKTRNLAKDGNIPVEQLLAQRKSIYEDLGNLYFEFGEAGSKTAKNLSKKIPRYLNESIEEYGKSNPEFYKNLKAADEIFGTIARSQGVERWISRTFKNSPITRMAIFGLGSPIHETGKLMYKVYNSPELRKLYTKAIGQAIKEDSKSFAKTANELDKKLQSQVDEEQWEFID